jgi:hypothetical protein
MSSESRESGTAMFPIALDSTIGRLILRMVAGSGAKLSKGSTSLRGTRQSGRSGIGGSPSSVSAPPIKCPATCGAGTFPSSSPTCAPKAA